MRHFALPLILSVVIAAAAAAQGSTTTDVETLVAARGKSQARNLEVGQKGLSSRIDSSDPSVSWSLSGEEVTSNYEVYRFDAQASQDYVMRMEVTINRGFKKKIMVPVAFVLSPNNQIVPLHESMEMTKSFVKGVLLRALWTFRAPQDGAYHLIVGADNRFRDKIVDSHRFSAPGAWIDLAVAGTDTAKFTLEIDRAGNTSAEASPTTAPEAKHHGWEE